MGALSLRWLLAAAAVGLLGACSGSTAVVPGGERDDEVAERAVSAEARLFAVRVTERRWSVPPQRVLLHHTPLWVSLRSLSDAPLRLEPEAWSLTVEGGSPVHAAGLERVVTTGSGSLAETRLIRGQGLRSRSIRPGEAVQGFVFFRERFSGAAPGTPVTLRIELFDPEGARAIDSIELPLQIER